MNHDLPQHHPAAAGTPSVGHGGISTPMPDHAFATAVAPQETKDEMIRRVLLSEAQKEREKEEKVRRVTRELAQALREEVADDYLYMTERFKLRPKAIFDAMVKWGEARDYPGAVFQVAVWTYRSGRASPELMSKIQEYFKL